MRAGLLMRVLRRRARGPTPGGARIRRATSDRAALCLAAAALAAALATVAPLPAAAQQRQAQLSCALADHNFLLDLVLPLRPDGGADARGMQGRLEISHQKLPHERRQWSLDRRQPTQLWLHDRDLRLRLVLGLGEALLDITIEATRRQTGDAEYAGTITLRAAEGVRLTGRITCAADWP